MQKLLECLSPQPLEALLASAERREADLLQQLRETDAKVSGLAARVRQCHLDERAAWDLWLLRPAPEAQDVRYVASGASGTCNNYQADRLEGTGKRGSMH